jgi:prepilin-type N-terminal cleavage/methylation domain-containing protein
MKRYTARYRRQRGFSLIEMLVALFILSIVLAIVTQGIVDMQNRNNAVTQKVDATQQTRDYIDQMVRDIHNAGYPPAAIFSNPANPSSPPDCLTSANPPAANIACGVLSFSSTQVIYEADLDGTGTIYRIFLNLVPGPTGGCPCTLQRGVLQKAVALANPAALPTFYTEVNNVLNSGDGSWNDNCGLNAPSSSVALFAISLGGPGNYNAYANADAFEGFQTNGCKFYDNAGLPTCNAAAPYSNPGDCGNLRSIRITANVATAVPDPQSRIYGVSTIISRARKNGR